MAYNTGRELIDAYEAEGLVAHSPEELEALFEALAETSPHRPAAQV